MDTVISILAILFVVIAYAVVFVAALVNIYFERRAWRSSATGSAPTGRVRRACCRASPTPSR